MRQTSRAVALLLLLESAQAAAGTAAFAAGSQQSGGPFSQPLANTNPNALVDRKSQYVGTPITTLSWDTAATMTLSIGKMPDNCATAAALTKNASASCMECLNRSGVWCSQTYSYNVSTGSAVITQSGLSTAASNYSQNTLTSSTIAAGDYDKGSCCGLNTDFVGFVGKAGVLGVIPSALATGSASTTGAIFNLAACVAAFSTTGDSTTTANNISFATSGTILGKASWEAGTNGYTGWWCSNGLYKRNTVASTNILNATTIISQETNKRKELAQVACPQNQTFCSATVVSSLINTTAVDISLAKALAIPLTAKCTWVAHSVLFAPTFTMAAGTDALGLVTQNWVLHHMEYTTAAAAFSAAAGSLTTDASSTGYVAANVGVNLTNYVPLFDMPAEAFNTLRTWYGRGYVTPGTAVAAGATTTLNGFTDNSFAPYQNSATSATALTAIAGQYYGNVANYASSSISAGTPTATSSYGLTSSTKFDVRVARFFPAQVAQMSWAAGTAQATLYASKLTSYNTAKATWDAYVAILAKNAKTDAFAAAFSPPKAPTVPPLPNMPWTPAAYSGYVKQTPSEAKIQSVNTTVYNAAAQPTNQQFWYSLAAAQSIGGWGSFTAQVLTYRAGFGKSFGTIGYSGDANKLAMSQVWNYPWMCGTASAAAATPTAACDATYTTSGTDPTTATAGATTANSGSSATSFVVALTLWSIGNKTSGTQADYAWSTKQSLKITWQASAFSSTLQGLTAIAAATPATAASSLTGLAGAQALAASTAAALAAAAALY